MNITITGGAGYIGNKLCRFLVHNNHKITCIDWLEHGIYPIADLLDYPNFKLLVSDINSPMITDEVSNADIVIHLAGVVGFPACKRNPILAKHVNIDGAKRIFDNSKSVIFTSSGSVYGNLSQICTEDIVPNPLSLYAEQKLIGEQLLDLKNSVILRPATAFGVGPRTRDDLLINNFTKSAVYGEKMTIFEGDFKRTFISVNDLVRCITMAIAKFDTMRGEIWNVGSELNNCTKFDICNVLKNKMPKWSFSTNITDSFDQDMRNYEVDYSKIKNIGFTCHDDIPTEIDNIISYYRHIYNSSKIPKL